MSAYIGLAIYPDKRVEEVTFTHDTGLEQKQEIVGGWIEPVGLLDGSTMYVNEEFRFSFGVEDFNSIASDAAGRLGHRADLMLTGILGAVVVVGPLDGEGWDTDVTDITRKVIERIAREAGR